MDSEFDIIGNVLSWLAAFGVFGIIFVIIWSLWRYEDPLEAICVEKGWKVVSVERLGTLWKVETRQGLMCFWVGSALMNRGSVRLILGKNYYERVWLFELEFDAPFPEDLEI